MQIRVMRRPARLLSCVLLAVLAVLAVLAASVCVPAARAAQGDCGQPLSTGMNPVATDALFVLRAAVALVACERCQCDVDNSGATTATDALSVLRAATGQPIPFDCPPCGCDGAEAPTCAGDCANETETCGPDPFNPQTCQCLNACESSSAPTCGGSCVGVEEPGLQCIAITFEQADETVGICECLPPGIAACSDVDAPECFGVCQPGSICTDNGGSCTCVEQPLQGTCASAVAPSCGGTCTGENLCQPSSGGGCSCAPASSAENCFDAESPVCGGACIGGELCAVGFLGDCDCAKPCELSAAPACGGDCDAGEQCVSRSVSFGASSVEFCDCDRVAP